MSWKHIAAGFTMIPFLASAPAAQADVLASYAFTGFNPASGDTHAESVASNVAVGPGVNAPIISAGGNEFVGASGDTTAGSEADSLTEGDYISFTVTPSVGYQLNLTNLTFNASTSWGGSTPATWNVALYSSVGGFTSSAQLHHYGEPDGSTGNAWVPQNVDLSSAAFQGLTGTIEFRIYFWDGAGGSTSNVRVDDIVLNGAAELVPEPASVALLGLGGAAALIRRRRA